MQTQIPSADSLFGLKRKDSNAVVNLLCDFIDHECSAAASYEKVLALSSNHIVGSDQRLGSSVAFYLTSVMQNVDRSFLTLALMDDEAEKFKRIASTYSFLFTAGMHFQSQLESVDSRLYVSELKEQLISSIFLLKKPSSKDQVLNLEKSLSRHLQKCAEAGSSAEKFAEAIFSTFLAYGLSYLKQDKGLSSLEKYLFSLKQEWEKNMPAELNF